MALEEDIIDKLSACLPEHVQRSIERGDDRLILHLLSFVQCSKVKNVPWNAYPLVT